MSIAQKLQSSLNSVVFLTAVNYSVRNVHAVQKKMSFCSSQVSSCMLIKYGCVCQPHLATRIKHRTHREHSKRIWRDFRFRISFRSIFRKNNSDFSTTLPSVWSSPRWKCRPEMEEMAWKIRDINHWNENFRWKANKSPFSALRRYRGRRDLRHASRRWWRQRLQKGRQCKKLTAHFSPQVNVKYEVCNFRQPSQRMEKPSAVSTHVWEA